MMADFKLDTTDLPTLQALGQGMLGLTILGPDLYSGAVPGDPNPEASFLLNIVGTVSAPTGATTTNSDGSVSPVTAPVPGYWSGLRINGANPFSSGRMTIPPQVKVYFIVEPFDSPAFWSLDGVTPAPDYVAGIGNLA